MKKVLTILLILVLLIIGGIWYMLSEAGNFIHTQIEKQGTRYLGTPVTVENVDLAYSEGRLSIAGTNIKNPENFSDDNAIALGEMSLDLGGATSEPYVIQNVSVAAPDILYEVNASGDSNLLVLKDNIEANLPEQSQEPEPTESEQNMPRVIVENVTVSNVRLRLNFEQLQTAQLEIDKKSYEVTLPTFNAGPIGKPDGLPADQVGAAVMNAMLDNVIKQAKTEARERLKAKVAEKIEAEKARAMEKIDAEKERAREKLDQEKDKLMEKASDKLGDLFKRDDGK